MSISITTDISCDFPSCSDWTLGCVGEKIDASLARQNARANGWLCDSSGDFCPKHKFTYRIAAGARSSTSARISAAFVLFCAIMPGVSSAGPLQPLPAGEYIFQGLNITDAVETSYVLHHGGRELNPLLGSHPSDGELILFKAGAGLLHAGVTEYLLQHHATPRTIRLWEDVSIAGGIGVDGWNAYQISRIKHNAPVPSVRMTMRF